MDKFNVYYDIGITKEIYQIIEKDYPFKHIDSPNITESKGKLFLWSVIIMALIYYSAFPPLFKFLDYNHSTTPKQPNYYAEFKEEVIKKHIIKNENTTSIIQIEVNRDWNTILYLSNYYSEEFNSIKIGDSVSTMEGDSNLYVTRIDTSFIVRKIR